MKNLLRFRELPPCAHNKSTGVGKQNYKIKLANISAQESNKKLINYLSTKEIMGKNSKNEIMD